MGNTGSISIRRLTEDGETTEVLEMTQEEYNKVISKYGTGQKSEQKLVHHRDHLKLAQAAVFPDEELKEENFNRVNTDGFEKAVVLLKFWADMTMREIFNKRNFRIEMKYNAEEKKTTFAIYTQKEEAGAGEPHQPKEKVLKYKNGRPYFDYE